MAIIGNVILISVRDKLSRLRFFRQQKTALFPTPFQVRYTLGISFGK